LLFVGLLAGSSTGCATCYFDQRIYAQRVDELLQRQDKAMTALKAAWRTLDPKQSDDFRKKLEAAVGEGGIQPKTAEILGVAFKELSYHRQRTRSTEPQPTCYEPTILGSTMMVSREKALKQIELLNEARARGAIDDNTARKTREVLARELELLYQAENMRPDHTSEIENRLTEQYDQDKIPPSDPAKDAAKLIVEMERQP
jgi:hypothetical protein